MKLYTKKDILWNNGCATLLPLRLELGKRIGVTKLINYGGQSFMETMIATHGRAKAEEIVNKSRKRGNIQHAKLETQRGYEEIIPLEVQEKLGHQLGSEVFLYGEIFGVSTLGFADAIFKQSNGTTLIVDYKTKSKPYYAQDLSIYWKQMVCYAMLLNKMYGLSLGSMKMATILIYQDGSPVQYIEQALDGYAKMLALDIQKKCKLYLSI